MFLTKKTANLIFWNIFPKTIEKNPNMSTHSSDLNECDIDPLKCPDKTTSLLGYANGARPVWLFEYRTERRQ